MTNSKQIKKALFSSIIALMLCFAMLLGTTFAWFTDSVTSADNKIVAGKLDVELYLHLPGQEPIDITNNPAPIFGAEGSLTANANNADTLWEPGKTQVAYLSIANIGTLDLKYKVSIDVENVEKDLYKVMEYQITPNATLDNPVTSWAGGVSVVPGTNATTSNNVELKAGEEHFFALSVHMLETAGNEYMEGQVNFDIKVLASQLASEEDSFGSDYDLLAPYEGGAFTVTATTVEKTVAAGEVAELASADNAFKVAATAGDGGNVTATITPTNATESVFDIAGSAGQSLVSYDVNVDGQVDGSDVTIDIFVGKNLTGVEVYHKGVKMDSGVTYSATTGYVTIVTDDFSPFEIAFYYADDVPLAKVTKLDTTDVTATLGMGGSASSYTLDTAYKFETTQTYEEAKDSKYAKYHADFVVSADKDVAANSIALIGYYEAYCADYNNGNWVALVNDGMAVEAGQEIRLLDILFGGDGSGEADEETGLTAGSINYEELCNWIPEFLCGVDMLDDSLIGTTITVELRIYEVEYDEEHNSWNKETGEYLSVCTYNYTFK